MSNFITEAKNMIQRLQQEGVPVNEQGIPAEHANKILAVLGFGETLTPSQQYFVDNELNRDGNAYITENEIANLWQRASEARNSPNGSTLDDLAANDGVVDYTDLLTVKGTQNEQYILKVAEGLLTQGQLSKEQLNQIKTHLEQGSYTANYAEQGSELTIDKAANALAQPVSSPFDKARLSEKAIGTLEYIQQLPEEIQQGALKVYFNELSNGNVPAFTYNEEENVILAGGWISEPLPENKLSETQLQERNNNTAEMVQNALIVKTYDVTGELQDSQKYLYDNEGKGNRIILPDNPIYSQDIAPLAEHFSERLTPLFTEELIAYTRENIDEIISSPEAFEAFVKEKLTPLMEQAGLNGQFIASEENIGFTLGDSKNYATNGEITLFRQGLQTLKDELVLTGASDQKINDLMTINILSVTGNELSDAVRVELAKEENISTLPPELQELVQIAANNKLGVDSEGNERNELNNYNGAEMSFFYVGDRSLYTDQATERISYTVQEDIAGKVTEQLQNQEQGLHQTQEMTAEESVTKTAKLGDIEIPADILDVFRNVTVAHEHSANSLPSIIQSQERGID